MSKTRIALFTSMFALTAALIACGGGGGGGGGNPGGGGPPPTNPPTNPPAGASGSVTIPGTSTALANASIVYTCGCSAQAGETTADSNGNFTLSATATATPNSPNPTYTMQPGRNYIVIGANATTHQEAWTIFFLGNTPSHNVYSGSGGASTTDTATAAAALYVFAKSPNNNDKSFDDWNYNAISAWITDLRNSPTASDTKLMTDINSAETSGKPLYTSVPSWDNDPGSTNATINADISALSDANAPTPCPAPGGQPACTGTPTP